MSAASRPEISLILPTHERSRPLQTCLSSVARQTLARDRFEVLVVSNLEDHVSEDTVRTFASEGLPLAWLVAGTRGVNFARNLGLRRARGRILMFMDDDCELAFDDHFQRVLELHDLYPETAMIGGGYLTPSRDDGRCRVYNNIINGWLRSQAATTEGQIVLLGGNLTVKKDRVPSGARFDEGIVYGGSEVSFQREMFASDNHSRVERAIDVWHRFSGPWTTLPKKAWLQGRGKRGQAELRHGDRLRRWARYLVQEPMPLQERAETLAAAPLYIGLAQLGWMVAEAEHKLGFSQRRDTLNFNA